MKQNPCYLVMNRPSLLNNSQKMNEAGIQPYDQLQSLYGAVKAA